MPSLSKCLVLLCLSAVLLASTGAFAALDTATAAFIQALGTNVGTGWDSTADPCTYSGITCVTITGETTYQGAEIALAGRSLVGTLPDANGASYITKIDLSDNNGISGTFPDSWASMTRVTDIDLSSTQLTGQVPDGWNGMVALQNIKISDTQACYRLPSWSADKLVAIVTIDLSNNYIYALTSSGFSALASSTTLTSVDIDGNPLCGCVNDEWRSNSVLLAAAQSALPSSTDANCFASAGANCSNGDTCLASAPEETTSTPEETTSTPEETTTTPEETTSTPEETTSTPEETTTTPEETTSTPEQTTTTPEETTTTPEETTSTPEETTSTPEQTTTTPEETTTTPEETTSTPEETTSTPEETTSTPEETTTTPEETTSTPEPTTTTPAPTIGPDAASLVSLVPLMSVAAATFLAALIV